MYKSSEPEYIVSADQLRSALERWQSAPFLAIDTEFVREQTYFPQPCLIQVSDGELCSCIDLLAIGPAEPLLDVLLAPGRERVLHAASQDLEIFHQLCGRLPSPLFDTQVAAALLGMGDQIGYAGMVKALRGVEIDKSLARTNWARRPLKPQELAYAADDVGHLAELYPELLAELEQRGRLEWLKEDCANLARVERYQPQPELAWKRLRGLARLARSDQHVAAQLTQWRELEAIRRDRPRKWILADEAVHALSERHPRSLEELAALTVLPPKTIERHGKAILECIEAGLANPAPALAIDERPDEKQKKALQRLSETLRGLAEQHGLPPSLLANRADLESLLRDAEKADIALLRGWRRALVGTPMLNALA